MKYLQKKNNRVRAQYGNPLNYFVNEVVGRGVMGLDENKPTPLDPTDWAEYYENSVLGKTVDAIGEGIDYIADIDYVGAAEDTGRAINTGYNMFQDVIDSVIEGDIDLSSSLSPYNYDYRGNRIPEYDSDVYTFDEAYQQARRELGGNSSFLWGNKRYTTRYREEPVDASTAEILKKIEGGVEDGSISQKQFDAFMELYQDLGGISLNIGKDNDPANPNTKMMGMPVAWNKLGLKDIDHVNPITGKLWLSSDHSPSELMKRIVNELTHVQQQREMGRGPYTGQYVGEVVGMYASGGEQGDLYWKKETEKAPFLSSHNTIEWDAHGHDNPDSRAEHLFRQTLIKPAIYAGLSHGFTRNLAEDERRKEPTFAIVAPEGYPAYDYSKYPYEQNLEPIEDQRRNGGLKDRRGTR